MVKELVEFFAERRAKFPSMHVYHYNHTERSSLERLTRGTDTESLFGVLAETGLFVDLYPWRRTLSWWARSPMA